MWSRSDLKARGKAAFFRNYWAAVVIALVVAVASGAFSNGNRGTNYIRDKVDYSGYDSNIVTDTAYDVTHMFDNGFFGIPIFSAILSVFFFFTAIIIAILKIFIGNLFIIGGKRFFMENREENTRMSRIFFGFKSGKYGNIVFTMFLRDLYTILWTLLLIIPGIIKYYEYRMVPYILCENPNMDRQQAFQISREMMHGQKMNTFVLDLSFIGWLLLSGITCGIFGIFFTNPYAEATEAELYAVLRAHAFRTGSLTSYELPGFSNTYY